MAEATATTTASTTATASAVWTLPVLPIKNTVLFPNLFLPLSVGRASSVAAVEAALAGEEKTLVVVSQRDANAEQPAPEQLFSMGTRALIKKMVRTPQGIDILVQGLERASWPGRLERIGKFLLDGAHNAAAATALAAFLEEFYPQGVWMIFGAMADKQFGEMIAILRPHVHQFIFTKTRSSRAKDPGDLQGLVAGSRVEPSVSNAIQFARASAPADTAVVICGSLYLIGEARPVLQ